MYEPRRALALMDAADAVVPLEVAAAAFVRPRRAVPTWRDQLRNTVPLLMSLAAAAIVGSLVMASTATAQVAAPASGVEDRIVERISRADVRPALSASLVETVPTVRLEATRTMYNTVDLTVRAKADNTSAVEASIPSWSKVTATPTVKNGFREVIVGGETGWVKDSLLGADAPKLPTGTSMAPCATSSSIEGGIRADTKFIYRSVCANFDGVNSYGGYRAGGLPFHRNGRAIDIMLTPGKESAMGWRIANYLIAHAREFNIDHIIFEQHIWTPSTPRWRLMGDRGGITANHFDHVHVAVRA